MAVKACELLLAKDLYVDRAWGRLAQIPRRPISTEAPRSDERDFATRLAEANVRFAAVNVGHLFRDFPPDMVEALRSRADDEVPHVREAASAALRPMMPAAK